MISTVLVTGGAGFVGAYVTRRLLAEGMRVVVYDMQPHGNVLDALLPGHREMSDAPVLVSGEITDALRLMHTCREHGVDAIVHLASPLTMDVAANPATGIRDVCLGTHTVFATAHEAGVRKIVWMSSVAVYGPASQYPPGPVAEDAFHRPASLYGASKSLCEVLARQMAVADDLDIVGLRLSVVYGAGRRRGYMTYPSALMRDAAMNPSVTVRFGDQRLHWQYVEEVADMCLAALTSARPGGGQVYNGFGDCRSWRDAAHILAALRPHLKVSVLDEVDKALVGVIEDYQTNDFVRDYGQHPKWTLESGIEDTLRTYKSMAGQP